MRKFLALALYAAFSVCLKAQLPVPLGSAASFGVLAGSTVTSTGATVVNGNLGVSPGTALTGFPPGIVTGGSIYLADPVAAQAESALTTAYNYAAGQPCPGPPLPGDIGGTTITPGVYCNSSSLGITGTVTLNGNGNPNAVFIFQIGSTLTTAAGNSAVVLINGAVASNVFWQVGTSATLGTNTTFTGTIMAQASITVTTGASLNGRALALIGAVTLADNAITVPAAPGSPLSLTCSYPSGQVGVAYSSSLLATGGTPPYSYLIAAGSLPAGLALNAATGTIAGTPTTAGASSDTSRVTDSLGASAMSTCGITIAPALSPALSLTCASNSGQVGQPYLSSLVAAGGTPPYTYSIAAGSLPPGLTLNSSTGVIGGTPSTAGPYSYTAKVTDSASASATSSCGPLIVAPSAVSGVPAPPSLILVLTALALASIYLNRERLTRRFRRG
ncbi:MAG TPA: ice-binding family protein [Bryobacteraceae bacterium]|nr:ice-binding family protein [Bryobacteraceae bacterium]